MAMKSFVFDESFNHVSGFVCAYDLPAQSIRDLVQRHPRDPSSCLAPAEQVELQVRVNHGNCIGDTLNNIHRLLGLLRKKMGSLDPLYRFSHQLFDGEASSPLVLWDLDRGASLEIRRRDYRLNASDQDTPLYFLALIEHNYRIMVDFCRLMRHVNFAFHTISMWNKRVLDGNLGKILERVFATAPQAAQRDTLDAFRRLVNVRKHLQEFTEFQNCRIELIRENSERCFEAFVDNEQRGRLTLELGRYVFLLYHYHVHLFDLFEKNCWLLSRKFLDFNTSLRDFVTHLTSLGRRGD